MGRTEELASIYQRRLWIFLKRIWNRIRRLPDSAHNIAFGFAIGVFVSFLPIIPLQILVALGLAYFLRGNLIAAFLGVNLHIPFIIFLPIIYICEYKLGSYILRTEPIVIKLSEFSLRELIHFGWPLAVGAFIVSFGAGIIAYGFSYYTVKAYQIIWKKKKLKYKIHEL